MPKLQAGIRLVQRNETYYCLACLSFHDVHPQKLALILTSECLAMADRYTKSVRFEDSPKLYSPIMG